MENLSKEIKELFLELGMPCIEKEVSNSPSYTMFHYNLADISQLTQVEKKVKFLSAYLHKDIVVKKSNIAHFALAIPNEEKASVDFYDKDFNILFNKDKRKNEIFVGIDDKGTPITINLNKIPHILIAGTTGSGKSTSTNTMICSLLRSSYPYDIDFYMIDTKRVELSPYKRLGDICSVATDFQTAIEILSEACEHIEQRYLYMEEHGLRTIPPHFTRIVVVIEELADLMMASKKVVEKYIVKIAQLGRACGVHLIIATQRPSADVLTGLIKANIDCRLALRTTSRLESRIILDKNGAECLKGNGDGLFKLPTNSEEIHLQCPFISDEQIQNTIKKYNLGE